MLNKDISEYRLEKFMKKLIIKNWSMNVHKTIHTKCYFYKIYTEMDKEFGLKECSAYFYNYLTCYFKMVADICPDYELVDTPECKNKYEGVWKKIPK